MKRWLTRTNQDPHKQATGTVQSLDQMLMKCKMSADFVSFKQSEECPYQVSYFKTLVNPDTVQNHILLRLSERPFQSLEDLKTNLPIEEIEITSDVQKIQESLMTGFVMIQVRPDDNVCVLVPAPAKANRQVTIPEVEYSVLGPKEAFVEALDTNLNMVRKRLPIPELQMKELNIGSLTKTKVAVLYINGIANEQNVNTIVQRIQDVQYDQIVDSSFIRQMIVDNKNSPFPQLVDTERPDRIASVLAEGKIAVMVDGSPQVFYGPTTLIEFFSSTEDYF